MSAAISGMMTIAPITTVWTEIDSGTDVPLLVPHLDRWVDDVAEHLFYRVAPVLILLKRPVGRRQSGRL